MSISRLLYVSRCAIDAQDANRLETLRALADRSAQRNAAAQITGCLLHIGDNFIQVLEGPSHAVERTFEVICCDFRHEEVKLIDLVPVKERMFGEWNMAFLSSESEIVIRMRDDLEEIRFLVGINAREALGQMRQVLEREAA